MQSDRRIYLTSRGEPCEEGDLRAAFLLVCAGGQLADARASELGITRGEDGRLVLPGQNPTAPEGEPADPAAGEPTDPESDEGEPADSTEGQQSTQPDGDGSEGDSSEGGEPADPAAELEKLSRPELVKLAQACGITKPHTQKSPDLVKLILEHRATAQKGDA